MNKNRKLISNYQLPITNYHLPFTKNGFSLMELMVVVAIVAILIIASMPTFRDFTRGRNIKNGATMVVSALTKTRGAAITYRKNYRTVLDTINHAVAIYEDNDVANPAENWEKLPDFVEFDSMSGVHNHYDSPFEYIYYLEFKPDGSLGGGVGASTENIDIIEKSTEETRTIDVNGLTGRIEVE